MATSRKRPPAKTTANRPADTPALTLPPPAIGEREAMIAEAAYYKAERRGFAPGYEEEDWFEAEREIDVRLSHRIIR